MNDPDNPAHIRLTPLQRLGAVVWPSFFVAALASVLFFAFIDPLDLQRIGFPNHPISREFGYSAGFLLAWLAVFLACGTTALLLNPPGHIDDEPPLE